jgi:RNA polymerase sigma-70 factor (ECF subfamily)
LRAEVEQALETLQQGHPDRVERALALLQDTVFAFSMRVCGQRESAEDTMQETLLKAVRYLQRFDSPKALAVWLYKVAKNNCLMSRRQSKFAPARSLSLEELMPDRKELQRLQGGGDGTPEEALLQKETREQLQQAILKLPPPYRLVLVLHDMEGLSTNEVARVLGVRSGTVRVRLHRARLHIRNELAAPRGRARPRPKTAGRRPQHCKELFAELSEYLDGALDDRLCEELEKHMDGCQPCQAFLNSLKQTVEQCRHHCPARLSQREAARARKALLADLRRTLASARQGESPARPDIRSAGASRQPRRAEPA